MKIPFSGTCQCGAVRYEVTQEPIVTVACHCRDRLVLHYITNAILTELTIGAPA